MFAPSTAGVSPADRPQPHPVATPRPPDDENAAYMGTAVRAAVDGYRAALAEIISGFDPDGVPKHHIQGLWEAFDAIEHLGETAKTMLATRQPAERSTTTGRS